MSDIVTINPSGISRFIFPVYAIALFTLVILVIYAFLQISGYSIIAITACLPFCIFIITFIVNSISNLLSRKVIINKTYIIDKWGVIRGQKLFRRDEISDCYLQEVNTKFSVEGENAVLVLQGKNGDQIGEINTGYFSHKDRMRLVVLIRGDSPNTVEKPLNTIKSVRYMG